MSFDEEYIDPHGECAAEIKRLQAENAELRKAASALLIEFVAARKEGNVNSFPPSARGAVRRMENLLARAALSPQPEGGK